VVSGAGQVRPADPDGAEDAGRPAARPSRPRWITIARCAFGLAVVVAILWVARQQADQVAQALGSIAPWSVLAGLGLAVAGVALPGIVWRDLLASQGFRTGFVPALRVFFVAQLGKYLPGGIWSLVAQVGMSRELRVPGRQAAAATLVAMALGVICALLLAAVTLPLAVPELLGTYAWVFLAVPVLAALLLPRSVAWWSGAAFRLLGRSGPPVLLPWRVLLRAAVLLVLSWVLLGLHVGVLVRGIDPEGRASWLLCLGVFALAWVAGFLVVVAPAGAGVREAALVLGLSGVLPAGAVLVVAVLSRALFLVADVLLACGLLGVDRLRHARWRRMRR
jgi:uncharacterized membrane protein YbhN (UPF0104 family)